MKASFSKRSGDCYLRWVVLLLAPAVMALPSVASAASVWINEFHYDNTGMDTGEFVELAGTSGTDLTGWTLVLYNGNGGAPYDTAHLSGVLGDDTMTGFGFSRIDFPANGLQNGSPDGMALVDAGGSVIQFLSYEGAFTAVGGPADGLTSIDVGVSEPSSTSVGESLQLIDARMALSGSGSRYEDFVWSGPGASSPGSLNTGQMIGTVSGGTPVPESGATVVLLGLALLGLPVARRLVGRQEGAWDTAGL